MRILKLLVLASFYFASQSIVAAVFSKLPKGPQSFIPYDALLANKKNSSETQEFLRFTCEHLSSDEMEIKCTINKLSINKLQNNVCNISIDADPIEKKYRYDLDSDSWSPLMNKPPRSTMGMQLLDTEVLRSAKSVFLYRERTYCEGERCPWKIKDNWYIGSDSMSLRTDDITCSSFSLQSMSAFGFIDKDFAEKEYSKFQNKDDAMLGLRMKGWPEHGINHRYLLCMFQEGDVDICVRKLRAEFDELIRRIKKKN